MPESLAMLRDALHVKHINCELLPLYIKALCKSNSIASAIVTAFFNSLTRRWGPCTGPVHARSHSRQCSTAVVGSSYSWVSTSTADVTQALLCLAQQAVLAVQLTGISTSASESLSWPLGPARSSLLHCCGRQLLLRAFAAELARQHPTMPPVNAAAAMEINTERWSMPCTAPSCRAQAPSPATLQSMNPHPRGLVMRATRYRQQSSCRHTITSQVPACSCTCTFAAAEMPVGGMRSQP